MSIDPLLLNVKPISEITTVNNPIKGGTYALGGYRIKNDSNV